MAKDAACGCQGDKEWDGEVRQDEKGKVVGKSAFAESDKVIDVVLWRLLNVLFETGQRGRSGESGLNAYMSGLINNQSRPVDAARHDTVK
jgi:hypothetical protein